MKLIVVVVVGENIIYLIWLSFSAAVGKSGIFGNFSIFFSIFAIALTIGNMCMYVLLCLLLISVCIINFHLECDFQGFLFIFRFCTCFL